MWINSRLISCFIVVLMFALVLSACGSGNNNEEGGADSNSGNKDETGQEDEIGQKKLTMPYVSWASTVAGVNVIKAVLEDVGYDIDLTQVEAGAMFSGLANGSGDISVGAVTLPTTHAEYWKEYKDQIDDLGVTMKGGTTIGLVVPSYVDIDSIEDLKKNKNNIGDELDWNIVGIDPGAGEMEVTKDEVMPGYGLDKWNLQSSSDSAMTAELKKAIDAHDPIIVTLWEPHWAFLEWDLKYLEDPEKLYGEAEDVHAVARQGLKKDAPAAYKVLKQFHWTADDMGEVMTEIHGGMDPQKAGRKWVEDNQDKVSEWTKGVKSSK